MKFVFARYIYTLLLLLCASVVYAQPANDNCANATVITIGNGGYATGVFTSAQYDMTLANIQVGETFAPGILSAGLSKKSIWYKFTLPTRRGVEVFLNQPAVAIANGDVGFTVYKSSTCLPGEAQISTQLTPIARFASSKYPCLDAGDYYVQISGNNNANGPVYVTVELLAASPAVYDQPATASKFGKVTNHTTAVQFDVSCQSLDNAAEKCLPSSANHTKSTWHTFTTPDFFDWFSVLLSGTQNLAINGNKIGFSLYEGDATTTPVSSLIPVITCDSLIISDANVDYRAFRCGIIKPNTTYTVKLLYPDYFNTTMRFAVSWDGHAPGRAAQPVSTIPALNKLGAFTQNLASESKVAATDYFSCNSYHKLYNCPKTLPPNGLIKNEDYWGDLSTNNFAYNLSNFYSFSMTNPGNLTIQASHERVLVGTAKLWLRLYKQTLGPNCTDLDTANIVASGYENLVRECFAPGDYVLQVMGCDSALTAEQRRYFVSEYLQTGYSSDAPLALFRNLGLPLSVSVTVTPQYGFNKYALSAPGKFFPVNANGLGIMQPLVSHQTYAPIADTMGCFNTVLPDNVCFNNLTKASYYQFVNSDSGSLYYTSWSEVSTRIYKGDANAIAISQNKFNYPEQFTGLAPYSSCLGGPHSSSSPYETNELLCITPGTFALVGMANLKDKYGNPSITRNLSITFKNTKPKFGNPAQAENLGDLWARTGAAGGVVQSLVDTFTCYENPFTIDGFVPCKGNYETNATKQAYRQFYLSKPSLLTIESGVRSMLFSGKATDGLSTLKVFDRYGSCRTGFDNGGCAEMPAGWYTIVSYGWGASFANPVPANYWENNIATPHAVKFTLRVPICVGSFYNRPAKAAIDTLTGQPFLIQWGPKAGHTAAYPITSSGYSLYTETFTCTNDTPFINHPIAGCSPFDTKVAYWVFRITQESFVAINTGNYWHGPSFSYAYSLAVFAGNARTNASLLNATPIQPCIKSLGHLQLCKLQPGDYTLAVFAPVDAVCQSVTPSIYIDQVGYSRFDHANNAYDFGLIKPDSTWYKGKPGDTNPLNAGRAPSNDFFYCTTGSQATDPLFGCRSFYEPNIYKSGNNNPIFTTNYINPQNGSYPLAPARNLWYTFTADKGGVVRVRVNNKTPGRGSAYTFHVYKSNADGSIPFATLVATGGVDSSTAQGLSFVAGNLDPYCDGGSETSFSREACSPIPERYYLVVANRIPSNRNAGSFGDPAGMYPNHQVEVEVLFDSANAVRPKFDHYARASNMGTNLGPGIYKGATDNINCATMGVTDPRPPQNTTCVNRNLWYKFSTNVSGTIIPRAYKADFGLSWGMTDMQLYREIIKGDSTAKGLQYVDLNSGGSTCVSPGTYYLLIVACDPMADATVYPQIELIEIAGDFCSKPVITSINGAGNKSISANIGCHTIGTDYGEFNPTLTCPANANTKSYKTTWFRLDITGTDTLDVTVFLNENTNAGSTDVKYRMMTGNCNAMQEQSCVQDALTRNTYKCLAPGNSYFIQVFTPVMVGIYQVEGAVELNVSAVKKVDACLPPLPCIAVANFSTPFDCTKDRNVQFLNSSTYGTSIQYEWDFGYNNQKSSAVAPQFYYPALTTSATYTARLIVTNTDCGKKDTAYQTIFMPARPYVNLGNDTVICTNGVSLLINASSHNGSSYLWQNGVTTPTITASANGYSVGWVEVTYNNCKARDTIQVWINPIAKRASQTVALCNVFSVDLNAARGSGESYRWNTGFTGGILNVETPGYYWCDISLNGCIIRDSFLVVNPSASQQVKQVRVCQTALPYIADATVAGATGYKWIDNSTSEKLGINKSGIYWVDITLSGCTYRDTFNVTIDSFKTAAVSARICGGQQYTLPGGKKVGSTGIYKDSLKNTRGCDSLITTVNLAVDTVKRVSSNISICTGQSFTLPSGRVVSTAGNFIDTVKYKSGCDSIITNLNLVVAVISRVSSSAAICQGKTYTLPSGKQVSVAGIYSDTLKAKAGCDSLINTVDLKVLSPIVNTANASVCFGKTYALPSGKIASTNGLYRDTIHYAIGCDSLISNITVSVGNAIIENKKAFVCEGSSYTLPSGRVVSTSGMYNDTVRSVQGCDSLISTIELTRQTLSKRSNKAFICAGQQYNLPSGKMVNSTGIYNDTLRYTTGCDSVINRVDLSVYAKINNNNSVSVCFGKTYMLPSGRVVNASGLYIDTIRYTNGCDSLISNITLSIGNAILENRKAYFCDGSNYTLPSGRVVSTTGIYKDTVRSVQGCDSLISTIDLTRQAVSKRSSAAFVCAGQQYNLPTGKTVNNTGIYNDTLRYTTGCDSVINTIDLSVYAFITNTGSASICAGQSYNLPSGRQINASGLYRDTIRYANGCDSLITNITLTVGDALKESKTATICFGQNFILPSGRRVTTAGNYTDTVRTAASCDSLITNFTLNVDIPQNRNLTAAICSNASYTSPSGKIWRTAAVYTDTLRNQRGCDSLHFNIDLSVIPVATQSKTITICSGQSHTLPGGRNVIAAGIYTDTLKTLAGCDSIVTTTLQVSTPLAVSLKARTAICLGDTTAITATATGGNGGPYTYSWTGATGSSNTITATPTATTTYSVTVSDGCTVPVATASITIQTIAPPQPGLNNGTVTICLGASTTLQATGGTTYLWSPAMALSSTSIANPKASPTTDTRYYVTVTTPQGCVGYDSILVRVTQPFALTASSDTFVCIGSSVTLTANGAQRYQWSGGGISKTTATVSVRPANTTTYTVTGFGADQCFTQTKTIVITVIPLPQVNAGNDTTVMVGSSFVLQPHYSADVNQYRWTPAQYLDCISCANPITAPREPIIYTVTVRNQYQCEASDTRKIDLLCSNESVFVPNTFTPNADGVNDVWYPRGNGIKSIRFLRVYNRWGQLIFERLNFNADDRSAGWDGSFKGQSLPPDVYVYSLGMICDNNQAVETKGNVMVVR